MISGDCEEFKYLIELCQDARAAGNFELVMEMLEPRLDDFDDSARVQALVQMVYACDQAGDRHRCLAYAERIREIDPTLPLVERLLG